MAAALASTSETVFGLGASTTMLLANHGYGGSAASVGAEIGGATAFLDAWAASLRDRAVRLTDTTFRHFVYVEPRALTASAWRAQHVDPELVRFASWRQTLMEDALAELESAQAARVQLEDEIAALVTVPYPVALSVGPGLERDLGHAVVAELEAVRRVTLLDGGDAAALAELDPLIAILEHELFVGAPKPEVDGTIVTEATDAIRDALNESWFGDVGRGDLLTIQRALADLPATEFDAVIANLSDDELYRWFSDLDGIRGGNLNTEEEAALFGMLAAKGSAETLWRLTLAERGEKLAEMADAVLLHAPTPVRMQYLETAATEYSNDNELFVAMSVLTSLTDDQTLAVSIALHEAGALDRFGEDAQRLYDAMERGNGRDDAIPVEFVEGLFGGVVGAVKGLTALTIQGLWDRHTFKKAWGGVGNLGVMLFTDPGEFLSTVLDLETFGDNPSYWAGQLIPSLIGAKGLTKLARTGRLGTALKSLTAKLDQVVIAARVRLAVSLADETGSIGRGASLLVFAESKWDWIFGLGTGNPHNVQRSAHLAETFARVGITDTPAGRAILSSHLERVVGDPTNVVRRWTNDHGVRLVERESLLATPSGRFIKLLTTWEELPGGLFRFVTVIPKEG